MTVTAAASGEGERRDERLIGVDARPVADGGDEDRARETETTDEDPAQDAPRVENGLGVPVRKVWWRSARCKVRESGACCNLLDSGWTIPHSPGLRPHG